MEFRILGTGEPADPPRLHREPGSYLLRAGPQELDAIVFETLADQGRQALAEQRHATAAEHLAQALSRWRGPVLEDLPLPASLQPEIERLEELRMMVLEDRSRRGWTWLGVQPGPALQDLHRQILAAEPALTTASATVHTSRRVRQLPAPPSCSPAGPVSWPRWTRYMTRPQW